MSPELDKETLLNDYRARQAAPVLAIRGEILNPDEYLEADEELPHIDDADGCCLDARVTNALQLDFSPVQIEIRLGVPRDAAAALLRKAADWIEQDGDMLMELNDGQSARRIPPASELLQELDDEVAPPNEIPPA